MLKVLPNVPIVTVSPEAAYCGEWSVGPVWALLRSVLAERALIEATYERGGEITLRWNQNGPKVGCLVMHHSEHG